MLILHPGLGHSIQNISCTVHQNMRRQTGQPNAGLQSMESPESGFGDEKREGSKWCLLTGVAIPTHFSHDFAGEAPCTASFLGPSLSAGHGKTWPCFATASSWLLWVTACAEAIIPEQAQNDAEEQCSTKSTCSRYLSHTHHPFSFQDIHELKAQLQSNAQKFQVLFSHKMPNTNESGMDFALCSCCSAHHSGSPKVAATQLNSRVFFPASRQWHMKQQEWGVIPHCDTAGDKDRVTGGLVCPSMAGHRECLLEAAAAGIPKSNAHTGPCVQGSSNSSCLLRHFFHHRVFFCQPLCWEGKLYRQ